MTREIKLLFGIDTPAQENNLHHARGGSTPLVVVHGQDSGLWSYLARLPAGPWLVQRYYFYSCPYHSRHYANAVTWPWLDWTAMSGPVIVVTSCCVTCVPCQKAKFFLPPGSAASRDGLRKCSMANHPAKG